MGRRRCRTHRGQILRPGIRVGHRRIMVLAYSRDHRAACTQVRIGLVCTPEGLPLNFKVFAGNQADVTKVG